jgi:four helix bundle protein
MRTSVTDATLEAWLASQPAELMADPIWRLEAYRQAAFFLTCARADAARIAEHPRHAEVAGQLLRAAGSIAANIAEGYGRPTTADRIRYFSYALGSIRESLSWYEAAWGAVSPEAHRDRVARIVTLRRLVLGLLNRLRSKSGKRFERW